MENISLTVYTPRRHCKEGRLSGAATCSILYSLDPWRARGVRDGASSRRSAHARIQRQSARGGVTRLVRSGRPSCRAIWTAGRRKQTTVSETGPFDFTGRDIAERDLLWLTGGDVSWLADRVRDAHAWVPDLHLEGVDLGKRHLEGAKLPGAHLEGASLYGAHMERASLRESRLEGASLSEAHLAGANLGGAHLESAFLNLARMEGADLDKAHLEDYLSRCKRTLERSYTARGASGEGETRSAHLEGTSLYRAHMEGVLLAGAQFDADTYLRNVSSGPGMLHVTGSSTMRLRNSNAALGDIKWRDADLTVYLGNSCAAWETSAMLTLLSLVSDAAIAKWCVLIGRWLPGCVTREWRMPPIASPIAPRYVSAVCSRRTLRLPHLCCGCWRYLAGYGFRPGRALFWYLVTIRWASPFCICRRRQVGFRSDRQRLPTRTTALVRGPHSQREQLLMGVASSATREPGRHPVAALAAVDGGGWPIHRNSRSSPPSPSGSSPDEKANAKCRFPRLDRCPASDHIPARQSELNPLSLSGSPHRGWFGELSLKRREELDLCDHRLRA